MKKICTLLIFSLLVSALAWTGGGVAAAAESGAEYEGYIVKLSACTEDTATLLSENPPDELVGEQGLYLVDTPKEVLDLAESGSVEYFEPNYTVTLLETPDDEYYSEQWNLSYINASSAWDEGYTGEGVRVAVIDSGVNAAHRDFSGVNIVTGINVIDDSTNTDDSLGHGTFISGVLAAVRNNGFGIAGITEDIVLVPIKCFSDSKETAVSYIIKGIYTAVDDYNCSVINLSLGLERNMTSFKECVDYAVGQGAIILSAVGNTGDDALYYPAAYDNVVGIGSLSKSGAVSSFSNRNESVYVVAPGEDIISLNCSDSVGIISGSGTSYAVPHVTAMAVIAKSADPDMTVYEFSELLVNSSRDLGSAGYDHYYGYGAVDMAAFLEALKESQTPTGKFKDISGHWAYDYIKYVTESGLFTGVSKTAFSPDTNMTRAMAVTVLARLAGADTSSASSAFSDVPVGKWYTGAVAWGASNGIVTGVGGGLFDPETSVTREQMAVFMYRFAAALGRSDGTYSELTLSGFTDAGKVSDWATAGVAWAVENGLINGRTDTTLEPLGFITRAEVAAIITRFAAKFG